MINSLLEELPLSLALPGLKIGTLASEDVSARFELMLRLRESAHGSVCRFEYATELFEDATIECLAGQFGLLLEDIAGRPDAAISELEMLDAAERSRLLARSSKASDYLSGDQIVALIGEPGSCDRGDPAGGLQGYVLDRWLGLAPVGVVGELYIGGVQPRDDVKEAGVTASRFIPDPFGSGQRLCRSGELARWRANGVLEILDWAGARGVQAPQDDAAAVAYEAPRTPLEEVIAGIWLEMLGVERIGIHDNFFALGGHSLLATRVMARVRDGFQVDLPLRALFEAPTVVALADRVSAARRSGTGVAAPALAAQPRPARLALSFAQERLWVLEQIEAAGSAYNLTAAVRLRGALDVAALSRVFAAIVDRHEGLRTRFGVVDGGPVQLIDAPGRFELGGRAARGAG